MPGTSTWKMLTFNWLELISSIQHNIDRSARNPMVYETLKYEKKL